MSTSREKHELILSSLLSPPADIPKPPVSLQTSGSFLPTAGSTLIMLKDSSMLGSKSAEKIGSKEKKESEISSKTSDELKKELIEKINTALDNIGTEAKIPPAHSKNPAFAKTYLADAIANLRVYDDLLEEVYAGGGTIQSEYKEIRLPKPETKEAKQRDEKDKPKEPSNELTQVYYRDSTKLKIRTQKSKERFDGFGLVNSLSIS